MKPDCRTESFYTTVTQQKIDCFKAGSFCGHFNTLFEEIGCANQGSLCQEARPALAEKDTQRGMNKMKAFEKRK